jgi:hypothetical protein
MATAREYFDKDLSKNLRVHQTQTLLSADGESIEVVAALGLDFEANAKYAALYVPETAHAAKVVQYFLENIGDLLRVGDGVENTWGLHGTDEFLHSNDLVFTGRIVVYTAGIASATAKEQLHKIAKERQLHFVLRDRAYVAARDQMQRPAAFISHDSRDKVPLVADLASKLQSMLCPVWYDEYSLIPGTSLRASIERGLKECRKCVLVLSPNFLGSGGWAKVEYDSAFTREIVEQKDVIVPIWHGVTREQVYEYSPRLADRVAIPSMIGIDNIARRILRAISSAE